MSPAEYDFVIIGGGTAGLVLANRISEDPSQTVLVLEAGIDHSEDPRVKTPGFYPVLAKSELNWSFETVPQSDLKGRSINLAQGRALGGSSAINAHVFVPSAKSLIDSWSTLGNEGWDWDTLQRYHAKSYTSPSVDDASAKGLGIDGWTSKGKAEGPIQPSFPGDWCHPIREAWADTFKANGCSMGEDPFIGCSIGAFSCLSSIHPSKKERSYAASAYYNPIKHRKNLHVITRAFVEKIVFETTPSVESSQLTNATGVQYMYHGTTKIAACRKEVILAAGALQSPKILELSGIGNAELLKSHGIPLISNLPAVGENLHDHLLCSIGYEALDDLETVDALVRRESATIAQANSEYSTKKTGLLTSVGIYSYAYLPLPGEDRQAIEKLLEQTKPPPGNSPDEARARAYYEVAEKMLLNPQEPSGAYLSILAQHPLPVGPESAVAANPLPGNFLSIGLMLSHPLSRGSVHICSPEPSDRPAIDPKYLSHPMDIEVMARHMRRIDSIAASAPISKLLKQPLRRRDPASRFADLEAAKRYLQTSAISMWHLAGTCAMLPRERGGVVDGELRVYGAANVRVVDSSAIPLVSTANSQATVYAFAERAASLVKEAYGLE